MSSAYIAICVLPDIYIANIGDNTETPANMRLHSECALSIFTLNKHWAKKELIILIRSLGTFIEISLNTKPVSQVVS